MVLGGSNGMSGSNLGIFDFFLNLWLRDVLFEIDSLNELTAWEEATSFSHNNSQPLILVNHLNHYCIHLSTLLHISIDVIQKYFNSYRLLNPNSKLLIFKLKNNKYWEWITKAVSNKLCPKRNNCQRTSRRSMLLPRAILPLPPQLLSQQKPPTWPTPSPRRSTRT